MWYSTTSPLHVNHIFRSVTFSWILTVISLNWISTHLLALVHRLPYTHQTLLYRPPNPCWTERPPLHVSGAQSSLLDMYPCHTRQEWDTPSTGVWCSTLRNHLLPHPLFQRNLKVQGIYRNVCAAAALPWPGSVQLSQLYIHINNLFAEQFSLKSDLSKTQILWVRKYAIE